MLLPADPKAGYLADRDLIDGALREVMESGLYIMGPRVKAFEENFAAYLGVKYGVGVASGSDAVQLALRACGVGLGDKVITVSHTAVATVAAIDWIGAKAILVDIDADSYTMLPSAVEETVQRFAKGSIKAIVAVHLYGHPAAMDDLSRISNDYGIPLIEDCAQAHGALFRGRRLGSIGACAAFSFYPTKNLGAFGDGGAVVTNDASIAEQLRLLQQYGWKKRYVSEMPGYNSRLDELQAAILDVRLPSLDARNGRRRSIATRYSAALGGTPLVLPRELPGCSHVFHQYVVRSRDRDDLRRFLETKGIGTAILYPLPIHLQSGYRERIQCGAGDLVVTEQIAREILCLPIYPELSDASVDYVVRSIGEFFEGNYRRRVASVHE